MALQQRLHTKLVQKLILTPSLQQAIKLLPMSTLELADMLNQEVVENPLLEEVQADDAQAAEGATPDKPTASRMRRPRPTDGTTGTTPISSGITSTRGTGRGPSRK